MRRLVLIGLIAGAIAFPRTRVAAFNPVAEIRRNCTRCHSSAVVRAQRLSREEWEIELRKMESMGAKVSNRAALLDYLTRRYGPGS